ncbi:MAG: hypothetical protein RL711_1523, partial [Bacteroidota bacterium]
KRILLSEEFGSSESGVVNFSGFNIKRKYFFSDGLRAGARNFVLRLWHGYGACSLLGAGVLVERIFLVIVK